MKAKWPLVLLSCLALASASCAGSSGHKATSVRSELVHDSTTSQLRVLASAGKGGARPVAYLLHGFAGTGQDMVELATRLAKAGVVTFVPTYNTDLSTPQGLKRATDDIVCGYQAARRVAPHYGGDLAKPLAVVGWSLGADFVVLGGLGPSTGNSTARCPGKMSPPDVVVGLAGCYYQFNGKPVTWFENLDGWSNKSAGVYLVTGDRDTTCPSQQTERLAASLRTAGYHVAVTKTQRCHARRAGLP